MSFIVVFLLLLSGTPAAPDLSIVKKFEARYRSAHTLEATFLESYSENGRLVRTEAGRAYFRRPGKMRWEYQAPEQNLFLVDGKNAWFYVPADHTATRAPAKLSADWRTPLALLAGEMKVDRICSRVGAAADEKQESAEDVVLRCQLRPATSRNVAGAAGEQKATTQDTIDSVLFEVGQKDGDLVRILIRQSGSVQTEFHFKDWVFDPAVPESLFHFQPPPGVAIVNALLPSDQAAVQ
jgi:outer membrane lipoprotein carrier protein